MRNLTIIMLLLLVVNYVQAQKFKSEVGNVKFFSGAKIEDITAKSTQGSSVYNHDTGDIVFSLPIKSFEFQKALMQEHFNENYMESDKYPKAIFKGKVKGFDKKKGSQNVSATGEMTVHGVVREITVDGTMDYRDGKIYLDCVFPVKLEDHNIKIPTILWQNIAEEVDVTLNFVYKPL